MVVILLNGEGWGGSEVKSFFHNNLMNKWPQMEIIMKIIMKNFS